MKDDFMNKDYTDIENTTLAEYAAILKHLENKIVELLKERNLKELKKHIKLYFELIKLQDKKHNMVIKENKKTGRL